jgi:hypothetical protein
VPIAGIGTTVLAIVLVILIGGIIIGIIIDNR